MKAFSHWFIKVFLLGIWFYCTSDRVEMGVTWELLVLLSSVRWCGKCKQLNQINFFVVVVGAVSFFSGFGKRNYFKWKCIYNFVEKQNSESESIGCPAFNHCIAVKELKVLLCLISLFPYGWDSSGGVISKDTQWTLDPCTISPGQAWRW